MSFNHDMPSLFGRKRKKILCKQCNGAKVTGFVIKRPCTGCNGLGYVIWVTDENYINHGI